MITTLGVGVSAGVDVAVGIAVLSINVTGILARATIPSKGGMLPRKGTIVFCFSAA